MKSRKISRIKAVAGIAARPPTLYSFASAGRLAASPRVLERVRAWNRRRCGRSARVGGVVVCMEEVSRKVLGECEAMSVKCMFIRRFPMVDAV